MNEQQPPHVIAELGEKRPKGGSDPLIYKICLFPLLFLFLMVAINGLAVAIGGLVHQSDLQLGLAGVVGFVIFLSLGHAILLGYRSCDRKRKRQLRHEYCGAFGPSIRPTENAVAFLLFMGVVCGVASGIFSDPILAISLSLLGAIAFAFGLDRMRQRAEIRRREKRRRKAAPKEAPSIPETAPRPGGAGSQMVVLPTTPEMTEEDEVRLMREIAHAEARESSTRKSWLNLGSVLASLGRRHKRPIWTSLAVLIVAGLSLGGWVLKKPDEATISGKPVGHWVEGLLDRNPTRQGDAAYQLRWAKPEDLKRYKRKLRRAAEEGNGYARNLLERVFGE
jgi:hypothetical protein